MQYIKEPSTIYHKLCIATEIETTIQLYNLETIQHQAKYHKILIGLPSPIRRYYDPKYTLTTLALVSYLCSSVAKALHRHRKGIGSIAARGPMVHTFFLILPCLNFRCV